MSSVRRVLLQAVIELNSCFDKLFSKSELATSETLKRHKDDGVLIIWGGEDISPSLYNDNVSSFTDATNTPSSRDKVEASLFKQAVKLGIPIIGICRGAQLACALSGGKLFQDITGHTRAHDIETISGKVLMTSSLHHQMMKLSENIPHTLLAWSTPRLSKHYIYDRDLVFTVPANFREPEIVFFPHTRSLAIQGHPEFLHPKDPFCNYCSELVEEFLK